MTQGQLIFTTSIVGVNEVKAALASLQSRFIAMQKVVNKPISLSMTGSKASDAKLTAVQIKEQAKLAALKIKEETKRHTIAMRHIEKEAAAQKAAAKAAAAEAKRISTANRNWWKGTMGRAGNAALGTGRMLAGGAIGGTMALAAYGVRNKLRADSVATEIANATQGSMGETRGGDQIQRDVTKLINDEAQRTGMTADQAAMPIRTGIQIAGNEKVFEKSLKMLNDFADAAGVSQEDIGSLAGNLLVAADASGEFKTDAEKIEFLRSTIGKLAKQGQDGAIELGMLAGNFSKFSAITEKFSGDLETKITQLGALAQLSRQTGGSSSAEEAGTAAQRFADDLLQNRERIKKASGVDVIKDNKFAKSPLEMIVDIISGAKGDIGKVKSGFGIRSFKMVSPLLDAYNQAGGGEKGRLAARKKAEELSRPMEETELQEKAARTRASLERRWQKVMNEFTMQLGTELVPALESAIPDIMELAKQFKTMVPSIVSVAKAFINFATWLAGNPLSGAGALIGASFAKEMAAAKLKDVMMKAVGFGAPGPAGKGSGVGGALNGAASAFIIAAAAMFAYEAGKAIINYFFDKKDAGEKKDFAKDITDFNQYTKYYKNADPEHRAEMLKADKDELELLTRQENDPAYGAANMAFASDPAVQEHNRKRRQARIEALRGQIRLAERVGPGSRESIDNGPNPNSSFGLYDPLAAEPLKVDPALQTALDTLPDRIADAISEAPIMTNGAPMSGR